MRGVSTVLDATLFLLLVGGAVATLVAGTGGMPVEQSNPAATETTVLATSTATVNYTLSPAAEAPTAGVSFPRTNGSDFERSAHGTLASLLADAAVGNATVDERDVSLAQAEFVAAVRAVVRERTGRPGTATSVVADWRPYPGAPLEGRVQVGDDPPRGADVHAATFRVDCDVPAARVSAERVTGEIGYGGIATLVARTVVRGLFPPRQTELALRGDYPVDTLAAQRYRRAEAAFDASGTVPGRTNVTRRNARLAEALSGRLRNDMRGRFDSPSAAASAVETGTVRVVVRTWSP